MTLEDFNIALNKLGHHKSIVHSCTAVSVIKDLIKRSKLGVANSYFEFLIIELFIEDFGFALRKLHH